MKKELVALSIIFILSCSVYFLYLAPKPNYFKSKESPISSDYIKLCALNYEWFESWGGSNDDDGYDIVLDDEGNIYIVGITSSFGAGGRDVFLVKYDHFGNQLWNKSWGGGASDLGYGVVIDNNSFIYITGATNSIGIGNYDAFLVKFDSTGNYLWNETWGGIDPDYSYGIALDDSGNIYVSGITESYGTGSGAFFLVKYDTMRNQLWNKTWGNSRTDWRSSLVADETGNIYVSGTTEGIGAGLFDAYLAKYNSTGGLLWSQTWGRSSNDWGDGLTVDKNGNTYITGTTTSSTGLDTFLVKFNSAGTQIWDEFWEGSSNDYGHGITQFDGTQIYITGYTESFGNGGDGFIIKYDANGMELWSELWGGSSFEYGKGIIADEQGDIYITGTTNSFGAGQRDALFIKINEDISLEISFGNYHIIIFLLSTISLVYYIWMRKKFKFEIIN